VEGWESDFKKISTTQIAVEKYARAMVNYNLLAVDYFYDQGDFDQRRRCFKELMKWQEKANLESSEKLDLAKTLCFQDQFSSAVQVLKSEMTAAEIDQESLFYFLQISQYDKEEVSESYYEELQKKASELYPKAFCEFFTTSVCGKQLFENVKMKNLYCEKCN
jgi:hypothetical protein